MGRSVCWLREHRQDIKEGLDLTGTADAHATRADIVNVGFLNLGHRRGHLYVQMHLVRWRTGSGLVFGIRGVVMQRLIRPDGIGPCADRPPDVQVDARALVFSVLVAATSIVAAPVREGQEKEKREFKRTEWRRLSQRPGIPARLLRHSCRLLCLPDIPAGSTWPTDNFHRTAAAPSRLPFACLVSRRAGSRSRTPYGSVEGPGPGHSWCRWHCSHPATELC